MPANLAGYLAFSLLDLPFLMSPCRGVLNTPHKTTRRGEYMFVGCPIFGRQGRAQKHTPHKRPEGADSCLLDAPFSSVRVGRKSIRPTKRPDRGGFKTMGRAKFLPFGAYNMDVGGVAPWLLHPFLVLIQEKEAKRKSRHQGCRPIWPGTGMGRQGYRGIWPRTRPSRF